MLERCFIRTGAGTKAVRVSMNSSIIFGNVRSVQSFSSPRAEDIAPNWAAYGGGGSDPVQ